MRSLRNLISRRASKALENQETSMTENLNEIDMVVASSFKQKDKKPKKGKKRPLQIEREEDMEIATQEFKEVIQRVTL